MRAFPRNFSLTLRRGLLLAATGLLAVPAHAVLFPQRFTDHSLCCGPGGPLGLDGVPVRASDRAAKPDAALSTVAAGAMGSAQTAPASATPTVTTAAVATAAPLSAASTASPSASTSTSTSTAAATAAASVAAVAAAPSGPPEVVDGYLKLDFERLASFTFVPPAYDPATKPAPNTEPPSTNQIPEAIRKFDGQKAVVTGFMLATKMDEKDNTLVKELLLVRDPMMCCYGVVPQMNEWVVIKMTKPVRNVPDVPVSIFGKLRVKEIYEDGYMTGIYLLEGDKSVVVKG